MEIAGTVTAKVNHEMAPTVAFATPPLRRALRRNSRALEQKIEELLAGGMSRKEATAAARRQFGNVSLAEQEGRECGNGLRWRLSC